MFRTCRLARTAVLSATLVRRAAASADTTAAAAAKAAVVDGKASTAAAAGPREDKAGTLQHSEGESSVPSSHVEEAPLEPPHVHRQPKFLFKGRRGNISPEYYSTRSNAGHPDAVAELLGAGRDDPEWMWLKLLCFVCAMATFGTTLYGYFFAEHVKYFKDEPWSPFTY
uniref:Uncharacterized protein n=1 Tax=Angomonas deanei TaxID=59799 RepID=C6K3K5_9TRYP|nr:conserved hypothetical protein [Angomonas deanei]